LVKKTADVVATTFIVEEVSQANSAFG